MFKFLRAALVAAAIALCAPFADGTDYYADDAGSGTTCSIGSPCLITEAVKKPLPHTSDVIYLNPGNYTDPLAPPFQGSAVSFCINGLQASGSTTVALKDCAGSPTWSGSFPVNSGVQIEGYNYKVLSTSGSPATSMTITPGLVADAENDDTATAIGLSGNDGTPITVRAVNITLTAVADVRLDGTYNSTTVVKVQANHWWDFEGFDACCTADPAVTNGVIVISGSNHTNWRKINGWDGPQLGSNYVWSIQSGSQHTLIEDFGCWGLSRKCLQNYSTLGPTTLRRGFLRFDNSTSGCQGGDSPKMSLSPLYNSTNIRIENLFGFFPKERVPFTQAGTQANGTPCADGSTFANYDVPPAVYGIIGMDAASSTAGAAGGSRLGQMELLGSLFMMLSDFDQHQLPRGVFIKEMADVFVQDVVSYIPPGNDFRGNSFASKRPFLLAQCTFTDPNNPCQAADGGNTGNRLSSVGGAGSSFGTGPAISGVWTITNHLQAALASAFDIYTGAGQANLCYEYLDGALTGTKLWPPRMNTRWVLTQTDSGYTAIDPYARASATFGAPPGPCNLSVATPTPTPTPAAPTPTPTPTPTPQPQVASPLVRDIHFDFCNGKRRQWSEPHDPSRTHRHPCVQR